jgi:osmoprotectant transport system permease protein
MWPSIFAHAARHAELALGALALACLVGAPLGAWAARSATARVPIIGIAALGRTLPSIAVLMLLLPLVGVGVAPAIIALTLLGLAPITINVDLALRGVPAEALDAATGLGMSARERFWRVSVPHALPLAVAGLRTAGVEVIASATLATFIGAGGLGDDIVQALQTANTALLLAACLVVAAMAFVAEFLLARLGTRLEVAA